MEQGVITKLFDNGSYELILDRIFGYLDGPSLEACHLVCKKWRLFLKSFLTRESVRNRLINSFQKGVASTRRIHLGGRFLAMACDSTSLAVGLESGHMELWERTGTVIQRDNFSGWRSPVKRLGDLSGHTDLVKSVDMSPDWLVSGSWDCGVRLWDRNTGQCVANTYHHGAQVTGVFINQSQGWILSSSRDGTVTKINLQKLDGQVKLEIDQNFLACHGNPVIAMSVDGTKFLTGGSDSRVLLWDMKNCLDKETSKTPDLELLGHGNGVRCVFLKGQLGISGARDKTARIWNLENGRCLRILNHSTEVRSVTLNSHVILTGDDYPDVFVWNLKACLDPDVEDGSLQLLSRTLTGHNGLVHTVRCTPTGIVTCDVTGLIIERDYWSCIQEGPGLRILRCSEGVNCMVVDDRAIACGLLSKVANVYDRKTLKIIHSLKGHTDHIWSIDMNRTYVVTGSWDATVNIWCRKSGLKIYNFNHPHSREISSVKISENRVYLSCLSGSLAVLKETLDNPDKFALERLIPNQKDLGEMYSMDVDDKYILTGHTFTSTALQLWSLDDVSSMNVIIENTSESIVWNLHLAYPLALVCRDNENLDVYHLESKSCLKTLRHQSKVLNATLFKGIVVVGCQYGLLVFWNLHDSLISGQDFVDINHPSCIKILAEHSGAISNISIDDEELITDDYDGVVILRKMKTHSHLRQIFVHQEKRTSQILGNL